MRILHVGWGYPPEWMGCGPVVYVHNLALAQAEAGDKPMVVCASDRSVPGRPLVRPGGGRDRRDPLRAPAEPARRTCTTSGIHCARRVTPVRGGLRARPQGDEPEVVHIHNLVGLSFDVIGAAKRYGARVVSVTAQLLSHLQPRRPLLRRRRALRGPARAIVLELPRDRPGRRCSTGSGTGRRWRR